MAGMTVLERSHVFPHPSAPGSCPTMLPLTYLDLPWLFSHPSQRLFFYDYPHPASHFATAALPLLKSSLSLALRHFTPLAGHFQAAPARRPAIACSPRLAAVGFTVAESGDDFHNLTRIDNFHPSQVAAHRLHPLMPALTGPGEGHSSAPAPLMAVQVTLFPGSGFSVGIVYLHVAADERTFNSFLKAWASFSACALTGKGEGSSPTMYFDRAIIKEMPSLEHRFLNEWWKHQHNSSLIGGTTVRPVGTDDEMVRSTFVVGTDDEMVRSTFVVGPTQMELVKSWITTYCKANGLALPVHLSPYVLACAFLWVVQVKTYVQLFGTGKNGTRQYYSCGNRTMSYFGFIAGGISRIGYHVPGCYFGNCVGFGRAGADVDELAGTGGIFHAADAIGSEVKRLDRSMLEDAESWISDRRAMSESELHVVVAGSPKVDFYETDFGWGRPRKIEEVSTDWTGAVSLHKSRDVEGAIEVGLSLSKAKMDAFSSLFSEGLRNLRNHISLCT